MNILSSGKSTHLLSFPNLETKSVHQHASDELTDFQFFPSRKLFVEANKKSGLELIQIKSVSENDADIVRIRKMRVENLNCIACPKQDHESVALGLSNGQVKLLKYKTSEYITKFAAENNRFSVTFLDFNASDEYLSSVYENGSVSLYGLKTKTKIESLNFDEGSTLARFHPIKRFHLASASYKGSVIVYDIQAKKKIFKAVNEHRAPCRDISMCPLAPDVMVSVGYDSVINVFDTRKRGLPQKIKYIHPLSTVALSECGKFCCAGNLKGGIIAYDLRNTKSMLNSQNVHDSAVVRLAFVPQCNDKISGSINIEECDHLSTVSNITVQSSRLNRDSFCEFLDFNSFKNKDKSNRRFSNRRDSFDWKFLDKKNSDFISESVETKLSFESENEKNSSIILKEVEEKSKSLTDENLSNKSLTLSLEKNNSSDRLKVKQRKVQFETVKEEIGNSIENKNVDDNKENQSLFGNMRKNSMSVFDNIQSLGNLKIVDESEGLKTETASKNVQNVPTIQQELRDFRNEINEKLFKLESDIKFDAERIKWQIFEQNFNLWLNQTKAVEEISNSITSLLQSDSFYNDYQKLKQENIQLKEELLKLRNNH